MNETTANTPHLQGGKGLLPYPVIVSAVSGDVDAMNTVLKYYEGYINTLSTRTMYDETGCPHPWLTVMIQFIRQRLFGMFCFLAVNYYRFVLKFCHKNLLYSKISATRLSTIKSKTAK